MFFQCLRWGQVREGFGRYQFRAILGKFCIKIGHRALRHHDCISSGRFCVGVVVVAKNTQRQLLAIELGPTSGPAIRAVGCRKQWTRNTCQQDGSCNEKAGEGFIHGKVSIRTLLQTECAAGETFSLRMSRIQPQPARNRTTAPVFPGSAFGGFGWKSSRTLSSLRQSPHLDRRPSKAWISADFTGKSCEITRRVVAASRCKNRQIPRISR